MIRAKGHFWLAIRPDWVGDFNLAGAMAHTRPLGRGWAAVPPERWRGDAEHQEKMRRNWDAAFADLRQDLVFIGAAEEMSARPACCW